MQIFLFPLGWNGGAAVPHTAGHRQSWPVTNSAHDSLRGSHLNRAGLKAKLWKGFVPGIEMMCPLTQAWSGQGCQSVSGQQFAFQPPPPESANAPDTFGPS